jgi:PucR C-terminal helix-turn-helix domain
MTAKVPWHQLSPALADVLRPVLPTAVHETVAAISREVPAYRGALDSDIGPTVRRGVEIALERMLMLFGTSDPALDARSARFYRSIGAGENDLGRSLEALLAAYRTGARVNWELMAAAATDSGIGTDDLVALAESIFVYIDELSAISADGHASAQAVRSSYRNIVRAQLAEALIDGLAVADPARVSELAEAAQWPLPHRMAVALVTQQREGDGPALPTAPSDALVVERDSEVIAIIPDPSGPGRRRRLTAALDDAEVFVGTIRVPAQAPLSLAHALRIRHLVRTGVVSSGPVVAAADHLPELVVTADEPLWQELSERALRPLADLTPARRTVMQQTLASWLRNQGDRAAVARDLVVHPQTVSYRLARLTELFAGRLSDPRTRLSLQLALLPALVGDAGLSDFDHAPETRRTAP